MSIKLYMAIDETLGIIFFRVAMYRNLHATLDSVHVHCVVGSESIDISLIKWNIMHNQTRL